MEEIEKKEKLSLPKLIAAILLLVAFITMAIICFYEQAQTNHNKTFTTSDISVVDDNLNLYQDFAIDSNGNLVGANLCSRISGIGYSVRFDMASIMANTKYWFKCYGFVPGTVNYSVKLYINDSLFYTIAAESSYNTSIDTGFAFTTPNTSIPSSISNIYIIVQFNTYVSQLGNCMINTGSTFKEWEPYGIWYSSTNYNNLQNEYNEYKSSFNPLQTEFILSQSVSLNGYDITSDYTGGTLFLANIGGGLGFYANEVEASSYWLSNGSINEINVISYFDDLYSISTLKVFTDLSHSLEESYNLYFYNNNNLILSFTDLDSETVEDYMNNNISSETFLFNKIIITAFIKQHSANNRAISYFTQVNNYAFGYEKGFNDGKNLVDSQYDDLVNSNAKLQNDYDSLSDRYDSLLSDNDSYVSSHTYSNADYLQYGINRYSAGYTDGANESQSLRSMVFAIADTPIRVFKQIFDFNILGINLAGITLSIMSLLIVIYLVKRLK